MGGYAGGWVGYLVGDSEAFNEGGDDVQAFEHGSDLGPAPMHHHDVDAELWVGGWLNEPPSSSLPTHPPNRLLSSHSATPPHPPTCFKRAMSEANFAFKSSFSMACPPYFTTTVLPRSLAMWGSACARISLSVICWGWGWVDGEGGWVGGWVGGVDGPRALLA